MVVNPRLFLYKRIPTICTITSLFRFSNIPQSTAFTIKRSFSKSPSSSMSLFSFKSLTVSQFPCLDDNYGYLIHDSETKQTAAIDTPCEKSYTKELNKRGWKLTHILNTHHHWDHTDGNLGLKKNNDLCRVYGSHSEKSMTPGIDVSVRPGEIFEFGSRTATVIDVAGHTNGQIAFYFKEDGIVFTGDSLFSLGCGKMFEGNPKQYWSTMCRLRDLPDDTTVFCAHEYTESNAKFAKSVEPNNKDLLERIEQIKDKRSRGEPTVPSILGEEKKTNPFLRIDISQEIRDNVGVDTGDAEYEAFGKLRRAKDVFKGNIKL